MLGSGCVETTVLPVPIVVPDVPDVPPLVVVPPAGLFEKARPEPGELEAAAAEPGDGAAEAAADMVNGAMEDPEK